MPAPGSQKGRNDGFRSIKPASDGILVERHTNHSRRWTQEGLDRLRAALAGLENYGASIAVKENASGELFLSVRLAFQTDHEVMDSRVYELASGFGFSLKLTSVPVPGGLEMKQHSGSYGETVSYVTQKFIRTYHVSEGPNMDADAVDCVAEDLLRLASSMAPLMIRESRRPNVPLVDTPAPLVLRPIRPRDVQPGFVAPPAAAAVGTKSSD